MEQAAVGIERSSGQWLAAIPLHCGGTACVLEVAVFAPGVRIPRFLAGIGRGYKSAVFFHDGALHVSDAIIGQDETNAHYRYRRVVRYDFSSGVPVAVNKTTVEMAGFWNHYGGFPRSDRLFAA